MTTTNLLFTAGRALWRNKSRSVLTMLGVIIGVMSVILLLAIGSGLQNYIVQQFESLGTNMIQVNPGEELDSGGGMAAAGSQMMGMLNSKFRLIDVQELKKLREYITAVIPEYLSNADVEYKLKTKNNAGIYGTTADFSHMGGISLSKGEFFTAADVEAKRRVVILGPGIVKKLFGSVDPLGKEVKVNRAQFTVIGVLADKGGLVGASLDNYAFIPITTAHDLFDSQLIMSLNIQVKNKDLIPQAKEAIIATLSKRLNKDEFHIVDQQQMLGTINSILGILSAGLGGIAAISLVVGGIGIMNIMLVSVTERTREIGLRKAIGATPNIIMAQFLIESVVLSVSGGLLGVGIAYGITLLIRLFFPAMVTWWSVALAFTVSAIVGVIFGVYPARRAAKLSPIEALRYE
jgi:putative ABC transport system permease protein